MQIRDKVIEFFVTYGLQIVGAIIILAAGLLAARGAGRLAERLFAKLRIEPPFARC